MQVCLVDHVYMSLCVCVHACACAFDSVCIILKIHRSMLVIKCAYFDESSKILFLFLLEEVYGCIRE